VGVLDLELEGDSKQVKDVIWLAQKKHLVLASEYTNVDVYLLAESHHSPAVFSRLCGNKGTLRTVELSTYR
jgi:hypothetical protein